MNVEMKDDHRWKESDSLSAQTVLILSAGEILNRYKVQVVRLHWWNFQL